MYSNRRPNKFGVRWAVAVASTLLLGIVAIPSTFQAQTSGPSVLPSCVPLPVPRNADGWPIATTDSLGTITVASVTFSGATLLANDLPNDPLAPLTLVSVGPASTGNGTVTGTDPFTFTFAPGFTGADIFPYEIRDAAGQTAIGLVKVTSAGDTIFPGVNITAPLAGATVSGGVLVAASASDNIGIGGVTFFDGATQIGPEVTAAPFETTWDTTVVANGDHSLRAVARDLAGNRTTSAPVDVIVSNVAPDPVPPAPVGLVLALAFDEATGTTATDSSANGNTGTISGATRTTAGKFGGALSFDGVDDWVTVADAASLDLTSGMTLEAWVNPTQLSGWRTAILKQTPGGLAYALYAHDNAPRPAAYVNLGAGDLSVPGAAALSTTAWTHIAATFDGSNLRFYVNGGLVNTVAAAGQIITSNDVLRIGGNSVWGEFFTGLIDEVRVYNRALDAAAITTDMNTAIAGGAAPAMVTVPNIVGMTQAAAETAITGAGLTVGTISQANSATVPAGRVISQNPPAGDSALLRAAVAFSVSLGPADAPAPGGLVLALSFNETTGTTANDSSGNGNNGTVSGAAPAAAGKFGGALAFDGVDDWVTVADAASLDLTSAMTLEAWVKPSQLSGWRTAILKQRVGGLVYALYAHDDAPRPAAYVNLGAGDQSVTGAAALSTTDWTHIAATFDGSSFRFYVNGDLVNTVALSGGIITSGGVLRIGGNSVWGEYFAGLIDEVRVYNRALTADEIRTDMNTPVPDL